MRLVSSRHVTLARSFSSSMHFDGQTFPGWAIGKSDTTEPQAPWRGKTFCRGLEFSTTPFSIPRRETIEQGPLFGEPTYRWLPAKSKAQVRFLILLFKVPETFRGVSSVSIAKRKIDVVESGAHGRKLSVAADKFL